MELTKLIAPLKPLALWGKTERDILGIAYDSRKVEPGFLFVAVPGFVSDGHSFIGEAVKRGACALLISEERYRPPDFDGAVLLVKDARRALSRVGDTFYGRPSRKLKLIGITGTNGKTTTAYLIANILRQAGKKTGLLGTIEYQINERTIRAERTTPESLDLHEMLARMARECEYAVMEVSSHSLVLGRVADCSFSGAVFTNLTPEHLDFHLHMENYFTAKRLLFRQLGPEDTAVTNLDDPWGGRMVEGCAARVVTYGSSPEAEVRLVAYEAAPSGLRGELQVWGERRTVLSPLLGDYNLKNISAAVALSASLGIDWPAIARGIEKMSRVPGRFEAIDCGQDFTVVVDYAHTADALDNLLRGARRLKPRRLITLFGCGGQRDREKRPRMGEVAVRLSDYVIITSDNPRQEDPGQIIREVERGVLKGGGSEGRYQVCPDRRLAIEEALKQAEKGDMVVIAGKGHEDYQVIGKERFAFDDREVAREALRKRLNIK